MITNLTRRTRLSERTFFALKLNDRIRGMICRRFEPFDAMVFPDCSAIHTFFMSMPIDVIFVDRNGTVVKVRRALRPWHPCVWAWNASTVIEMPSGTLDGICVEPGDRLELKNEAGCPLSEPDSRRKCDPKNTRLQRLQRRIYS